MESGLASETEGEYVHLWSLQSLKVEKILLAVPPITYNPFKSAVRLVFG